MPTYQYACTVCDHRFEQVQSFSDPSLTVCPECQGKLRKLYSSVGVVFKGSGFYRTDSRSSSTGTAPAATSGNGDGGTSSTTKSETKSESTSATKSESKPASTPAAKAS